MTDSPSKSDDRARHGEDRARRTVGWVVLLGGIVGALLSIAVGDGWRTSLFDEWQRIAPRTIASDKVAVVLIDSLSLETVGPWPWPRIYLQELTDRIGSQHPKAIGFDMIFGEPDALGPGNFVSLYPEMPVELADRIKALPTMDQAFAVAIGTAPVVLARSASADARIDPDQVLLDPVVAGTPPPDVLRTRYLLASIPELDDQAFAHGMIDGQPDSDGIVRRVPLTVIGGKRPMAGMAVELARLGDGAEQMAWRGGSLQIGRRLVAADSAGRMIFKMGEPPPGFIFSAANILAGNVPRNAFAGKVVIIGLAAQGTPDIVTTPLDTEVFGVLVQAQAVDAILHDAWLARPAWLVMAEWGAAILLVLIAVVAGGSRRYWLLPVGAGLVAALWLGSLAAFDRANLLFDPVRPSLIGFASAIAMGVTLYLMARADRARLAAALTEQRVAAAEQEGELNAARRIQQGMVPGAERLAGLDPRAEIGAVLRPAKSVGGDFYDALMIGPDKLLFVIGDVTGKGVPAALYMALSKALSKSVLSRVSGDLGVAVAGLNRELMAEADDEMGVTVLAGVLDCATGELAMVNAGHENPLVVRADGTVESLPMRGGPPFCVVDFPYPEEGAKLASGDTLVLITDGATEAQDASQALLGLEGVVHALQSEGAMPATMRAADLADRIRAYEAGTEPSDDLTIVTLRYCAG